MSRKRRKKRKLTEDELKLMRELLEKKVPGNRIASQLKCSTSVVSERKKAWFGPPPVKQKPPSDPTECPVCGSLFSEEERCVRCDALAYNARKKAAEKVGIEYPKPAHQTDWLDDLLDERWSDR